MAGLAGATWLTPVGQLLARAAEAPGKPRDQPSRSSCSGCRRAEPAGDLRPAPRHATSPAGTGAIATAVKGVQLAAGLERTAEEMGSIALVRSMVSKEGDHERGTYTMKTGFRPDPTVVHPSIGAICCHELPAAGTDIPRHVSILPSQWPARGGFLGDQYDAFQTDDPAKPVPDTQVARAGRPRRAAAAATWTWSRARSRAGRRRRVEATLHRETVAGGAEDDEFGAAQGVRRDAGAAGPAQGLRRHAVRPRLPGGAAADRGGRALRRGDAGRLGHARQQPRSHRETAEPSSTRPSAR